MKVAIVIVHYLGKELTKQALASVKRLNLAGLSLKVIVVNNNPKENLKDLKKEFKDYLFVKTKKNLGFTGGNNFGIKKALKFKPDFVFLLNNDTFLDKNLLVNLVKSAKKNSQTGILGPKIYFASGSEYHQDRYRAAEKGRVFWFAGGLIDWRNVLATHRGVDEVDKGQYEKRQETDFVSGCAILIKKEVFEKIGLLDDRYFLYLEDADFCQRAKRAGFKVIFEPKGKLWHFNASSSQVGGPLHDYFLTRNRMLFGWHFAPWRAKIALMRESLKLLFFGRRWQKTAIKDFYLKKFGQGSWHD